MFWFLCMAAVHRKPPVFSSKSQLVFRWQDAGTPYPLKLPMNLYNALLALHRPPKYRRSSF